MNDRFALCVESGPYEVSLERWKVYPVLDDADAERHQQIRVIDESGEDYLYPAERFVALELPAEVLRAFTARKAS